MGQGAGFLLAGSSGAVAGRFQSARRAFPKDDLFLCEYIFAKCWEQGLHRRYGELFIGGEGDAIRKRLVVAFQEPFSGLRLAEDVMAGSVNSGTTTGPGFDDPRQAGRCL